jgi:predicted dehydrogenase
MTASVALIGANGHGAWHRRRIASLGARVRLVGLADPQSLSPPGPPGVPVFTDHRAMLAAVRPEVVVICTPPHTHLALALDAIAAGCDILLEKPPVASLAAHHTLTAALSSAGLVCQVGFQALGSAAWQSFRAALPGLGVTGLTAAASWKRDDAYYARAAWAGRRVVDGRAVIDGSLVNPLAHAVMQALASASAIGAGRPRQLTVERYRTRPIETDDTAFARITFDTGLTLVIAVTLAGEDFIPGEIAASTPSGQAVLEYPTDRLALPESLTMPRPYASSPTTPTVPDNSPTRPETAASSPTRPDTPTSSTGLTDLPGRSSSLTEISGRTDLLMNLLDHRSIGTPLLVPLSATADFTMVLEALTTPDMPTPHLLSTPVVAVEGPHRTITGINEVIRKVVSEMRLPSELGVPWAIPPVTRRLPAT